MIEKWFRAVHVPMTIDQFHLLPRHAAYKYEYIEGEAWLSPRPRTFNALLELRRQPAVDSMLAQGETVTIRPFATADWAKLPKLFAAAFEREPPFSTLTAAQRLDAAGECLHQVKSGGDGPVLEQACLVADAGEPARPVGAILVTLIPRREEGDWWDGHWDEFPESEDARRLLGRPHLTWVFVALRLTRYGIGSALLAHAVNAVLELGYTDLASTFLLGNDSTMLWHWRNGFRVLPYAGSMRQK